MRICGHHPLEWHTSTCSSESQQGSVQLRNYTIVVIMPHHFSPVDAAHIAGSYGNLLWRLRATKKRMISKKDLKRRLRVERNSKTQC